MKVGDLVRLKGGVVRESLEDMDDPIGVIISVKLSMMRDDNTAHRTIVGFLYTVKFLNKKVHVFPERFLEVINTS